MARHIHMHLVLKAFLLTLGFSPIISSTPDNLWRKKLIESGFRVNLIHRDSLDVNNMTSKERVARAVERSRSRQIQIQNTIGQWRGIQTPVMAGEGDYLIRMGLGTPSVSFEARMDTGNDLIWTQCQPCVNCFSQASPIFDPSKSSTYTRVSCYSPFCHVLGKSRTCLSGCEYTYVYGDTSSTSGVLAHERFTIGDSSGFHQILFGCGHNNQGFTEGAGVVGLGRGRLSLISQLGALVQSKFSYCLVPSTDSYTSPLFFGGAANVGFGAKTVPYVQGKIHGRYYYVPLEGISVGRSWVNITRGTFDIKPDGNGGVILDCATTYTILDDAAFGPLKQAFRSAIKFLPSDPSLSPLDLCYDEPAIRPPTLTLHFRGGVDLELPADNYFVNDSGSFCLAMLGKSKIPGPGPSILGNVLQQNFHILFDNAQNTFSFSPAKCDSL